MKQHHPQHHSLKEAQTTVQFLLGPIKIKDGLFMGDQLAARDIEFIITNKVTHVINTVSKAIPNLYERFGVQYLSVHWTEKEENIFDKKNNAINAIFTFIDEAMDQGESCLIHSLHGKSRAFAVLAAYMMKKYNWNLAKCIDFTKSKKDNMQIRNNYMNQLQDLEKRMFQLNKLSSTWNEIKNQEDLVLANTYYNSKKQENKDVSLPVKKTPKKKLVWDEKLVHKVQPVMSSTMSRFKDSQQDIKKSKSKKKVKSILKGELDPEQKQFEQEEETTNGLKNKNVKVNDDKFISTINGNIVHVTVNNFITTQKKPQPTSKIYNTRPYSSDNKEREKKAATTDVKGSKLFAFDNGQNFASTFKNPYQMKMMNKIGSGASRQPIKKRQQIRNPMLGYERPNSAVNNQKKRIKNATTQNTIGGHRDNRDRQQMLVTGLSNNKRRYPSTNNKQQAYKWK